MTNTSVAQREVLVRLLDLTDQQERALDTGDIIALNKLSELRLQTIKDAAAFLPPRQPWAPEVRDLADAVQRSTTQLQQSTVACMAMVRRQQAQLNDNRQLTQYVAPTIPVYRASWRG